MKTLYSRGKWGSLIAVLYFVAIVSLGLLVGGTVSAAPPYAVGYKGAGVTTAVPGELFTIDFKVTNTGTTVYSGVKVIFHIPKGMSHSGVKPAGASVIDDVVTWSDVPIAAGKSFYPSLTLSLDSGTSLKDKLSIWVEVTGADMEANSKNFSVTAVAATKKTATTTTVSGSSLVSKINSIHRSAYGRNPTASEHAYWLGRVSNGDKATQAALLGAMQYHSLHSIAH